MTDLVEGEVRGTWRCPWPGDDPLYVGYHDHEWGRPEEGDAALLEKVILEGFQAGLSWITVLRKREAFRTHFRNFDPEKVARFGVRQIDRMLADPGVIRHRGKIESAINNARRAVDTIEQLGSLAALVWPFAPGDGPVPRRLADLPAIRPEAVALSKELKRQGWTFVGPTTMYAMMQAMGMVNDHLEGCHARVACERARKVVRRRYPSAV
ncbi:MAG TPA: DNA-3-methyladenine glycosylase I, partial [Acidimicrobiia bacterium]|nr:DNA-3-methyladenine glycosylase I [Acidimicrobiia bacterium]